MSTPTYTLSDILTNMLNAIQDILGSIASVVAENASTIATVVVLGGLTYAMITYGSRLFRSIFGWFRGLF